MATPFPFPVTVAQVGTYFIGQYYQVLQNQPDYAHQFYSDHSTMLRIDGNTRETATATLQIHELIMSLNITGIDIKTANSLESWHGGILVTVSGSLQFKDYRRRRKFMQTFFLSPQDKGYFVLNDIFHFNDEEPVHQHQVLLLAQNNPGTEINAPASIPKPVSNYMLGGDIRAMDFVTPSEVKENGIIENYGFSEQHSWHVPDSEDILDDNMAEDSNESFQHTVNTMRNHGSVADELEGEPQKHTYASILQVAKGQTVPSGASHSFATKNSSSEWDNAPHTSGQQPAVSSNTFETSEIEIVEEAPAIDNEDEIKSVYVRNLSPAMSASEIEELFKKFGRIRPDGVFIRSRKDVGICYAFVEFEDIHGVHNAVKAGSVLIAGRQVYIEERRPNSNIPSRGGRRGRGRGSSYQMKAPRGRFGSWGFGRGGGYDGSDREYNKPRGNGFYRSAGPRQDRVIPGNQTSRNG